MSTPIDTEVVIINVCDTETTGFAPPPNGDIVEIAVTPLKLYIDLETKKMVDMRVQPTIALLADPECKIAWEAMAVHHITPKMLKEAKALPASQVKADVALLPGDYWAFHNAAFDTKFFKPSQPIICTLETSRIIYPDAPSHKNQVLRYWLDLDSMMKPERVKNAETHRAGFDSYVTALLLGKMLMTNKMTIYDMAKTSNAISESPILTGSIPWGKHKGILWSKVPKDYLQWLTQNSQDAKVIATAKHYLKQPVQR